MGSIEYYEDDGTLLNVFVRAHVVASGKWSEYLAYCRSNCIKPSIVLEFFTDNSVVTVKGTVFETINGKARMGFFSDSIPEIDFENNHEVYLSNLNKLEIDD